MLQQLLGPKLSVTWQEEVKVQLPFIVFAVPIKFLSLVDEFRVNCSILFSFVDLSLG